MDKTVLRCRPGLSIATRLPVLIILLVLASVGCVGVLSFLRSSEQVMALAGDRLLTVAQSRAMQLTDYVNAASRELRSLADMPATGAAMTAFAEAYQAIAPDQRGHLGQLVRPGRALAGNHDPSLSAYLDCHERFHNGFKLNAEAAGVANLYLIDPAGTIVYSVGKGDEFARNLMDPTLDGGPLQRVFRRALDGADQPQVAAEDFSYHGPSEVPVMFLGRVARNDRGLLAGVVVMRLSPRVIDGILGETQGLGRSGDAVLIGRDGLLRSASRINPELVPTSRSPMGMVVPLAFDGRQAVVIGEDALHRPALLAYQPINLVGYKNTLVVTMTTAEAFVLVNQLAGELALTALLILGLIALAGVLYARSITHPLSRLADIMGQLTLGRLDVDLVAAGINRRDEIGAMARALDVFRHHAIERGRLEAEARRHADEQARLKAAKDLAEGASRMKSEFLTQMSHELRTPLNAVLGYTQLLLRDQGLTPGQASAIRTIHQSGNHLLTLINDLLDLAKIEAGKLELCLTPLDLGQFIAGLGDIMRLRAEDKGLDFHCAGDPALPPRIMADEKRLRQVLLNLLGNAIKFTERGQVTLRVALLARQGAQAVLSFMVSDSGCGIAPEHLQMIFQPFEQVGATEVRAGGTGLGLGISQRLVRLMGGEITVESHLSQGSRFGFELTVMIADLSPAVQMPPVPPVDAPPVPPLVIPPPAALTRLHALARGGSMREIKLYAEQLAMDDPRYQPFADRLRRLAGSYQSKAILTLAEKYLSPPERIGEEAS